MTGPGVVAIVNPRSGSARGIHIDQLLRARFADIEILQLDDQCTPQMLRFVLSDATLAIACGGDGTVNAAATNLGPDTALGIVPMGTANVLAAELGIPDDPELALEVCALGRVRSIDAMWIGETISLCRVAVGDFAQIGSQTSSELKQAVGGLAYALNALDAMAQPSEHELEISVDGRTSSPLCSAVIVTNLSQIGPRSAWGLEISADDGLMHVLAIRSLSLADNLGVLWNVATGEIAGGERIAYGRARHSIHIKAPRELPVVIDGEPARRAALEMRMDAGSIRVMTPATT